VLGLQLVEPGSELPCRHFDNRNIAGGRAKDRDGSLRGRWVNADNQDVAVWQYAASVCRRTVDDATRRRG